MYLARFWLDLIERIIPGWIDDSHGRGWPAPYFEFAAASTLVSLYNQAQPGAGGRAWYDQVNDAFCFMLGDEAKLECYPATHITVDGADLKVYRIAGSGWEWEDDSED